MWFMFLTALTITPRDLDLVLYGAYGCVGHIAALHLANKTGLNWAIAGRNETKLKSLAAELRASGGASSTPEIIVSPLTGDITPWVGRAKVVATAAGPFSIHDGERLLEACAQLGVHYADTSDEFYWQRRMIDRHHAAALVSGAHISLASGFCAVAADLGAAMAIGEGPVPQGSDARLDAWLERYSGGISGGVIHTTHVNASYPKAWNSDPYVLAPNASSTVRVDTLVDGTHYPTTASPEGLIVPNLFGDYDARFMRRSFAARGQVVKLRVGSPVAQYTAWIEYLVRHPGSWGSLGTCPTEGLLHDGSWRYRFRATVKDAASGARASATDVVLSGSGDPGYIFTARGLAEVALCLQADACRGDPAGGVLSPGLAVNMSALSARLESAGLLTVQVQEASPVDAEREQAVGTPSEEKAAAVALADLINLNGSRATRLASISALQRRIPGVQGESR